MRVLVVDDVDINRRVAGLFLKMAGYEIDEASDAASAWQKISSEQYDLVLLDISMPDMSGADLCRKIRAELPQPQPKLCAYTAHAIESEQREILAAGFDGIVTKPISKDSLLAELKHILG
ncbi:response regulator [Burkholderiaceae bacterium DAT-1]|nr:response regulator [Burkholderiaceae bacterium DAT-1]